jgi:hypothetical protein
VDAPGAETALPPETARALLAECVTVVRPGETLVIRVPPGWSFEQADAYQDLADSCTAAGRIPFRVLIAAGDGLAVAERA